MHRIRNPIRSHTIVCGAKCCGALQSAVAFWIVVFGIAIGCRPPENSFTKYQVGSSSMAPAWFGPHRTATCKECGQQSIVVYEAYDPVVPTRCFSCGAICFCSNNLESGEVIEVSQRDVSASLKRFDVVTFDTPESDEEESLQALKRIWALPNERIELHDGKAWIDGRQLQKSAKELAEVCVPLSRFPKDNRSHWWVTDPPSGESTRIESAAIQTHIRLEPNRRLEFRYVRPSRNPETPEMFPSPIVDDYPFNQNSIAQFHEVPDYMLAVELVKPMLTPWFVCLHSQGKQYRVRVGSSGDESRGQANSALAEIDSGVRLVIAVCDDRFLASTENRDSQWKLVDLEEALDSGNVQLDTLISITTTETLPIKRLLVARDLWLGPRESRLTEWMPSGTNAEIEAEVARGYFMLGDNLQLSFDSRDSTFGRVSRDRIKGTVERLEDSPAWILSLLNHTFREVE
jgi:hypothetical protein